MATIASGQVKPSVFNRQENRRLRKQYNAWREQVDREQKDDTEWHWSEEVVFRMVRRTFFGIDDPEVLPPIIWNYAYWQARSCGWDVRRDPWCRDAAGKKSGPELSVVWLWWTGLNSKERRHIHSDSRAKRSDGVTKNNSTDMTLKLGGVEVVVKVSH